jgi:hypothetical protein
VWVFGHIKIILCRKLSFSPLADMSSRDSENIATTITYKNLFGTDPDWNGALEETPRS